MMYFEITPGHDKKIRRTEIEVNEASGCDDPLLKLAPFCRRPCEIFEDVPIKNTCYKKNQIWNPSTKAQTILQTINGQNDAIDNNLNVEKTITGNILNGNSNVSIDIPSVDNIVFSPGVCSTRRKLKSLKSKNKIDVNIFKCSDTHIIDSPNTPLEHRDSQICMERKPPSKVPSYPTRELKICAKNNKYQRSHKVVSRIPFQFLTPPLRFKIKPTLEDNQNKFLDQVGNLHSQSHTTNPFSSSINFCDEQTINSFENESKLWLNRLLTLPVDLDSHVEDKVQISKVWLEIRKQRASPGPSKEQAFISHHSNYRLQSVRKAAKTLFASPEINDVFLKLNTSIDEKQIAIRTDKNLHLDIGLQETIIEIILSYNLLWLRIGLETIYEQILPLKSNNDIKEITTFIIQRLFRSPYLRNKKPISSAPNIRSPAYIEAIKKFTLKKFLMLVFFLDAAKQKKLIPNDPCLFRKNAVCKESKEIIIRFTRELITCMGNIMKHLRPLGYVVCYKQTYIDEYKYVLHDIPADITDGVRLTKLMEIILMKDDLLQQLRTPAVSRQQKVHNVRVALNALKDANFVVVGDITPTDIADGHIQKTFSLLWQIIHVFRAPLFEKAANIIQAWWRKKRLSKRVLKLVRTYKISVSNIENWYINRKKIREAKDILYKLRLERDKNIIISAVLIQSYIRRWLCLTEFRKTLKKVTLIQSVIRCYLARKRYLQLQKSVIYVQQKYRGKMSMKQERIRFLLLRKAVIVIQRYVRRWLCMKQFLQKKALAIKLQAAIRGYLQRKAIKDKKEILKKSKELERRHWAATKIQALFRGHSVRVSAECHKRAAEIRTRWRNGGLQSTQDTIETRSKMAIEAIHTLVDVETVIEAFKTLKVITENLPSVYNNDAPSLAHQIYVVMSKTNRSFFNIQLLKYSGIVLINLTRYRITAPKIYSILQTINGQNDAIDNNLNVEKTITGNILNGNSNVSIDIPSVDNIVFSPGVCSTRRKLKSLKLKNKIDVNIFKCSDTHIIDSPNTPLEHRDSQICMERKPPSKVPSYPTRELKICAKNNKYQRSHKVVSRIPFQFLTPPLRFKIKPTLEDNQNKFLDQVGNLHSQSHTTNPFSSSINFCDEQTINSFENESKLWLNRLLTLPVDLDSHVEDKVQISKVWLEIRKQRASPGPSKEQAFISHHSNYRLQSVRKAAKTLFASPEINDVFLKLNTSIDEKQIAIRTDKNLHLDIGLQETIIEIILSYNLLWLRIGLETIYEQILPLKSNNDIKEITTFIIQRLFRSPYLRNKKPISSAPNIRSPAYIEAIKKFTLKKFLMLVFFLDAAKQKKLIPNDPCLFRKNAVCKESKEIIIRFTRELITCMGNIMKHLRPLGYVVCYKQTYIDEYKYVLHDIPADITDGVRLTKLMEIILMKDDLLQQLRTPAVSRQQKVHNVRVALNALKDANFVVVGDITPTDIADGHIQKTFSLLWQIIHVFRAPLFEKAANIIQAWWRKKRLSKRVLKLVRTYKISVSNIENWYINRKKIREAKDILYKLRLERDKNIIISAVLIQSYIRRWLCLTEFRKTLKKVTLIQSVIRCYLARKRYLQLQKSVIYVQQKYRGKMSMKQERIRFLLLRKAVIVIQRYVRRWLCMKQFLQKKALAIKLQAAIRGYLQRKAIKDKKEILKKSKELERRHWAATKIQALFRGHSVRVSAECHKRAAEIRTRWRNGGLQSTQDTIETRSKMAIEAIHTLVDVETVIEAFKTLKVITENLPSVYNNDAPSLAHQIYVVMSKTNRSFFNIQLLKYSGIVLINLTRYRITAPKIYSRVRILPILKFMSRFQANENLLFCILSTYLWLFSKYDDIRQDLTEFLHIRENRKILLVIKKNNDRITRMTSSATQNKFYEAHSSTIDHSMRDTKSALLPTLEPDYGINNKRPRYFKTPQQAINCVFHTHKL